MPVTSWMSRISNRILFLICTLIFLPTAHAADEYLLGVGDVIKITVYDHPDLTTLVRIGESGRISFPLVGELKLGETTLAGAEEKLVRSLKAGDFVKNPQVSINVEQYHSQQVSVLGEVAKPGKFMIEGVSTVMDMIALAGGVNSQGSDTIKILRPTRSGLVTQLELDQIKLFRYGDFSQNVKVVNGDILYVPRMERFYIYGQVQRPGMYRLERKMTVMQSLAVAGGLTPRGTEKNLKVKRRGTDGIETIEVTTLDMLQDDDVIYVNESLF